MAWSVLELGPDNVAVLRGMLAMFGTAFDEVEAYGGHPPGAGHLQDLVPGDPFSNLAADRRDGDRNGARARADDSAGEGEETY